MRGDSKNACRRVRLKELPDHLFGPSFAPYLVPARDEGLPSAVTIQSVLKTDLAVTKSRLGSAARGRRTSRGRCSSGSSGWRAGECETSRALRHSAIVSVYSKSSQ
jgi:hypothetical protein